MKLENMTREELLEELLTYDPKVLNLALMAYDLIRPLPAEDRALIMEKFKAACVE